MFDLNTIKNMNEKPRKMRKPAKPAMTPYIATAIAEGFGEGEGASREQQIEAWQFLVDTSAAFRLQGWFGRTANNLIKAGVITPAKK